MLERLLQGKHAVRGLFIVLVGAACLSVMFKFLALPLLSDVTQPIGPFKDPGANIVSYSIDALVQTLLSTFLLASFFLFLVPEEVRSAQVEIIDPRDISGALTEHLRQTDQYWFRGRSARWFRSNVLPVLTEQARADGRTKSICVLLPDPCNATLMRNYADYRNSINFKGKVTNWTSWDIQKEIASAIVSIAHAHSVSTLIDARVGLLDNYSLLRSDITSKSAILTREDPKAPAIRCRAGSALYDTYKEEILQGVTQGKEVQFNEPSLKSRALDALFVKEVINLAGMQDIDKDEDKVQQILASVVEPHDPYK